MFSVKRLFKGSEEPDGKSSKESSRKESNEDDGRPAKRPRYIYAPRATQNHNEPHEDTDEAEVAQNREETIHTLPPDQTSSTGKETSLSSPVEEAQSSLLRMTQAENRCLKTELAKLREDVPAYIQARLEEISSDKASIEIDLLASQHQKNKLEEDLARSNALLSRQKEKNSKLWHEKQTLTARSSELEEELRSTKDLINTRKGELASAETFLGTADTISFAEVVQLVENLNDEIYQLAAIVSEVLNFDAPRPLNLGLEEVVRPIESELLNYLGSRLLDLLKNRTAEDQETLPIQIAVQAALVHQFRLFLDSWNASDGVTDILKKAYQPISKYEEQAIAGRWRALTRKYMSELSGFPSEQYIQLLAETISTVALISGCPQAFDEVTKGILDRFVDNLRALCKHAQALHKAMGQDVTSVDLTVLSFKPDRLPFNPVSMTDEYDEPDDPSKPNVSCTIALGFKSTKRIPDAPVERKILLKPKVVMFSTLLSVYRN